MNLGVSLSLSTTVVREVQVPSFGRVFGCHRSTHYRREPFRGSPILSCLPGVSGLTPQPVPKGLLTLSVLTWSTDLNRLLIDKWQQYPTLHVHRGGVLRNHLLTLTKPFIPEIPPLSHFTRVLPPKTRLYRRQECSSPLLSVGTLLGPSSVGGRPVPLVGVLFGGTVTEVKSGGRRSRHSFM